MTVEREDKCILQTFFQDVSPNKIDKTSRDKKEFVLDRDKLLNKTKGTLKSMQAMQVCL